MIAIPSFRLLRNQLIIPPADLTVKATGHSWYWEYDYPGDAEGKGGFKSDISTLRSGEGSPKAATPRLFAVDNEWSSP